MNKSIIKEIFYGNRGQGETMKESKEYWEAIGKAAKLNEELTQSLTEKQKELFNNFDSAKGEMESETIVTHFIEGFKIGLLLGVECMGE